METNIKTEIKITNTEGKLSIYLLFDNMQLFTEEETINLAYLKLMISKQQHVTLKEVLPNFYHNMQIKIIQRPELYSENEKKVLEQLKEVFNKDIYSFISKEQIENASGTMKISH